MRSISHRVQRRLRILAGITVIGFFVGLGYRYAQEQLGVPADTPQVFVGSALIGTIIALLVGSFELLFLQSRYGEKLRQKSFGVLLLARSAVAASLITFALLVGNILFIPDTNIDRYIAQGRVLIDICFSFAVSVVFVFIIQVRQIVGSRVFVDFILGRYYRPVREKRVFMFLDLADSTALAQRLGDEGVHALIKQFFFDVAGHVLEYEGETHRYVGDQVVVTWPYAQGVRDACCLRCVDAIASDLAARSATYKNRFGVIPQFRIGIHGGSLVAGECGEDRREIVFFGDTVNIAARVQSMCKTLNHRVLVTATTLADMHLPPEIVSQSLGAHQLRGRDEPTELFAVEFAAQ